MSNYIFLLIHLKYKQLFILFFLSYSFYLMFFYKCLNLINNNTFNEFILWNL